MSEQEQTMTTLNKTITINARGIKYEILLNSLDHSPESRLGKLKTSLETQNLTQLDNLCDKYDLNSNEFYFNRDPYLLNTILNYYQTGKLHLHQIECVLFIKNELEYWQLDQVNLEPCCNVTYSNRIEENLELIKIGEECIEEICHVDSIGNGCMGYYKNKLWLLFDKPDSSLLARTLFYFSILMILISTTILGK